MARASRNLPILDFASLLVRYAPDFSRTASRTGEWSFLCRANPLEDGIIDLVLAGTMMVRNKGDVARSRPLSLEKGHHVIDNLL